MNNLLKQQEQALANNVSENRYDKAHFAKMKCDLYEDLIEDVKIALYEKTSL